MAVIRDFNGRVTSLAWKVAPNGHYLVAGSDDTSVRVWQVIEAEGDCQLRLCWSSTYAALNVTDASIWEVQGLSPVSIHDSWSNAGQWVYPLM